MLSFAFPGLQRTWGDREHQVQLDAAPCKSDAQLWLEELQEDLQDDDDVEDIPDAAQPPPQCKESTLSLPCDLLRRVFSSLQPTQLALCEQAHRAWRDAGHDSKLWAPLLRQLGASATVDGFDIAPAEGLYTEETPRAAYRRRRLQTRLWARWCELWKGWVRCHMPGIVSGGQILCKTTADHIMESGRTFWRASLSSMRNGCAVRAHRQAGARRRARGTCHACAR